MLNLIMLICWIVTGICQIIICAKHEEVTWISYWCCYLCLMLFILERVFIK